MAVVTCLISFLWVKTLNSADVKAVPLSKTRTSGIPWVANSSHSTLMTAPEDIDDMMDTSCHFEWASTTIRKVLPWHGLAAKLMWIPDHFLVVRSHGCSGALGEL